MMISEQSLGRCAVITRHQLLVSPLVPYTSHNSAACLSIEGGTSHLEEIIFLCRNYLLKEAAPGSDAGLCVADEDQITIPGVRLAMLCKSQLVQQQAVRDLASQKSIYLEGLTGTQDGVIGAFSAVHLNGSGIDGRVLWLRGMREHANQTLHLRTLLEHTDIQQIQSRDGQVITDPDIQIDMGEWPRAVWLGGLATLIVEPKQETPNEWKVVAKDELKRRF